MKFPWPGEKFETFFFFLGEGAKRFSAVILHPVESRSEQAQEFLTALAPKKVQQIQGGLQSD